MEVVFYTAQERRENPKLLSSLLQLEERSFSDPWSEGMMKSALDDASILLFTAEENGAVLAYMMLLLILPDGEILNLAVDPDHRRRGIADLLFASCEAYCREVKMEMLFLEVRESNLPAISLYQKKGFTLVGKRKNYYRYPREDALVMRLLWE